MTTTPARPAFTQDARGHYPCPYPSCRQTFTRPQGVSRHWNQQHAADVGAAAGYGTDTPDVQQLEDDEEFSPEVEAMHALLYGTPDEGDQDDDELEDEIDPDVAAKVDAAYAERHHEPQTLSEALAEAPATTNGIQLLTPEQIHDATGWPCRIDPDAILALSDATAGLVDAIVRLRNAGYPSTHATEVVLDLIDKLDGKATA